MSSIVFRKNGGFYSVYGDDTYILYYLFNYRIIDDRVGFTKNSFIKLVNVLDSKCINYDNVNFKKRNKYSKYVELGKRKHSIDYRIRCILDKINSLSEDKIDDILDYIENKLWMIDF